MCYIETKPVYKYIYIIIYINWNITSEARYGSEMYLISYQKYLLIICILFSDFAKVCFKLYYFPLIINIPHYAISMFECSWDNTNCFYLCCLIHFLSSNFPFHSSVNTVTTVTGWTTETRTFSLRLICLDRPW